MPKPFSKEQLSIRSLKHLSYRLGLPLKLLEKAAENPDRYYLFWPKKDPNGKIRELCKLRQPLKAIQKAIHCLLRELYLPDSVHGGVKNKSHLTNAYTHCGKKILLNLDLENYFPSISHYRVYGLFRHELGCSPDVSRLLTKLCTVNGMVPQGSHTSTDIANLVFRKTDYRLDGFAAKNGLDNTRYVDDISISGEKIPDLQLNQVKSIIKESGFKSNDEKESLKGRNESQIVTGLSTRFKRPRVPRNIKRKWRKESHIFSKYETELLNRDAKEKRFQRIQGRSHYVSTIESTNLPCQKSAR